MNGQDWRPTRYIPLYSYHLCLRCVLKQAREIKITIFWGVTPCDLVYKYLRLGRIWFLHLQERKNMEAAGFFETLLPTYPTKRCYIPEDSNLHSYRSEDLQSRNLRK
jgi:hypothetical protein